MNSYDRIYSLLLESWTRKKFTRYQKDLAFSKTPEGKESREKAHQGAVKANLKAKKKREWTYNPERIKRDAAGIGDSPEARYARKRRDAPILVGGRINVGKGKPGLVNKFRITRKMLGGDD